MIWIIKKSIFNFWPEENLQSTVMIAHTHPTTVWKKAATRNFWKEIASCNHVIQLYKDEDEFITSLIAYTEDGLQSGESVIIIATKEHLITLTNRLRANGFDLHTLILRSMFIILDAEEILARFMINDEPDEDLFMETVAPLFERAGFKNRRIRAFGEMVTVLWAKGLFTATSRLEELWNKYLQQRSFTLYCAYPQQAFDENPASLYTVCQPHSKLLDNVTAEEVVFCDIR